VGEVEALRQADRLKADPLGAVSYELRSPLAVIKGYAATLLRHEHKLEQAERREFLTAIDLACDRLELIVNQTLEMSQLETGMLVPRFTLMDLEHLLREATAVLEQRLLAGRSGEHQVVLLEPLRTRRLPLVLADPRLLRDALDNLLENALKYSPSGSTIAVTLQVAALPAVAPPGGATVRAVPGQQDTVVVISVQDSGIGIPAEQLGRVFDRFHRVNTGLTRDIIGLGLGLAIVARIVALHGGLVWGESKLGEGSTFYVALPAAPEEDEGAYQNEISST
jgi:signal transduction histidine kinase